MKKLTFLFLLSLILISCKKDGLSLETGNLEINTENLSTALNYSIYTEDQWYRYLSNELSVPIFNGVASKKFTIKGLQKGYYGVRIYGGGNHWDKAVSIIPNRVNKLSFP